MATDLHTFAMLLNPGSSRPCFARSRDIDEFINEFYEKSPWEQSDHRFIDYVCSASRRGRLVYVLGNLCAAANIQRLGFLYGAPGTQYDIEINVSVEGIGVWCTWGCLCMKPGDLEQADLAISTLFEWSRQHIAQLREVDRIFGFNAEEVVRSIEQPVVTTEPTCDIRVWGHDEGDSVACLFAYLASMQQLMRNAVKSDAALWYMVQVPK